MSEDNEDTLTTTTMTTSWPQQTQQHPQQHLANDGGSEFTPDTLNTLDMTGIVIDDFEGSNAGGINRVGDLQQWSDLLNDLEMSSFC